MPLTAGYPVPLIRHEGGGGGPGPRRVLQHAGDPGNARWYEDESQPPLSVRVRASGWCGVREGLESRHPPATSTPIPIPTLTPTPTLVSQPDRAHYGFNHVRTAADNDAIECLLMSDSIFRVRDFKARRRYVDLVESVSCGVRLGPVVRVRHGVAEATAHVHLRSLVCRDPLSSRLSPTSTPDPNSSNPTPGQSQGGALLLLLQPARDGRAAASARRGGCCAKVPAGDRDRRRRRAPRRGESDVGLGLRGLRVGLSHTSGALEQQA